MKSALAVASAAVCVSALTLSAAGTSQAAPGQSAAQQRSTAIHRAEAAASAHGIISRGEGLVVRDAIVDRSGTSHVRFDRTYRGVPVEGGDFVVHQNRDGSYRSMSGAHLPALHLSTRPAIGARAAAKDAARTVGFEKRTSTPRLTVLATGQRPALTWKVNVLGRRTDGSPAGRYVFVNARTGRVAASWASVDTDTGTGNGLTVGTVSLETTNNGSSYSLVDATRGGNATYNGPATAAPLFTDADNIWGDGTTANAQSAGVDASYGIAKTWDYYLNTFGRRGIANDGKGARAFVHDGAYVNASWSDSCFCMRYGDGDSTTIPLVAIDVAGHEMSHGVTSRTAGLTYRGESGGLNEATSDIFGTNVEFYANNANDVPDYVIGEEIYRTYNPAKNFIRRMDNPSLDGGSLSCWTRRAKSVDVHYSSGIANHFFYLLSEGSGAKTINGIAYNSPTCNGSTLAGIGRDAAQRIWYRALTTYMTSGTDYAGARVATTNAATDLYGAASAQVAAVKATWSAVSVS